jgi:hypothetical protein
MRLREFFDRAGLAKSRSADAFFAPYAARPANPAIVKPDCIYAANLEGETQRPFETAHASCRVAELQNEHGAIQY